MSDTPQATASGRRLLSDSAAMTVGTAVSRVLGFIRTMLVVFALGNMTVQGDTFTLATMVPNSLYMIVAGGIVQNALVPQIVQHIKDDNDRGEAYINRVMTAFLTGLLLLTVVVCVFTPQVMSLWMDSTWQEPRMTAHRNALILMAWVTMPQVFFYGAFFLVGQVLNARKSYKPAAWAPTVNNVVQIIVLGSYALVWSQHADRSQPFTTTQALFLGLGSTLGIVLQALVLIPALRTAGIYFRPRWDLRGHGLGDIIRLAGWMFGFVILTQIAAIVVARLASGATVADPNQPGPGVLVYQNAYLTWILPHSLFTVSLATAMMTEASEQAVSDSLTEASATVSRTLRLALTFLAPCAVGFVTLAMPYAQLVFGNGAGAADYHAVGWTLMAFAVGLIPFTIHFVYLRGFYVLKNARTPFFIQVVVSGLNVVLALLWITLDPNPLTVAPRLALVYAASYLVGALLAYGLLSRQLPALNGGTILIHTGRTLLAVLPGAGLAFGLMWLSRDSESRLLILVQFILAIVIAVVAFFFVAKRLRIPEAAEVLQYVLRRGRLDEVEHRPAYARPSSEEESSSTEAVTIPTASERPTAGGPLLSYPEPPAHVGSVTSTPVPGQRLRPGDLIDDRYRLDVLLTQRDGITTWQGVDQGLGRPVLMHVLPPGQPRMLEILDAARDAALATDARFLRVLDTVLVEEPHQFGYIVLEYAPAHTLQLLLRKGAFTETEALWVIREIAEGLVSAHASGLFHRQLNPHTVVITATGHPKIVGFLMEAVIQPEPDDDQPGEPQDIQALGQLLYAMLVRAWPHEERFGLAAAPLTAAGKVVLPGQIRSGITPEVNALVDRLLNPDDADSPLCSAQNVVAAITPLLSGADASDDLAARLQAPMRPAVEPQPASATRMTVVQDVPRPITPDEATTTLATPAEAPVAATIVDEIAEPAEFSTPVPPPPPQGQRHSTWNNPTAQEPSRRWLAFLMGAFVVSLVVGLVGVLINNVGRYGTPHKFEPYRITSATAFDPKADGGDERENNDQAAKAIDADPTSAWTTEQYGRSADLNQAKPGVGLVLDLGQTRTVTRVKIVMGPGATSGQIRIPSDPTVKAAPMASQRDWQQVGAFKDASGEIIVTLDRPVDTRYVLVYLTRLPHNGKAYQGQIVHVDISR